jgi:hypothetical protein
MAHIKQLMFHFDGDKTKKICRAYILLKPAGEAVVQVKMPDDFYDCVIALAQAAADQHEQEMRAQILADTSNEKT